MDGIDHVDLVVGSLERSVAFYTDLLRPLAYSRVGGIVGERGERVVYLSRHGEGSALGLRERQSGADAHDRYALGIHHLAFAASSRAVVDELADWARRHATVESGPREYDYAPGYYAVFLYDPDGLKLEIAHIPGERDLASRLARLEQRLEELEGR